MNPDVPQEIKHLTSDDEIIVSVFSMNKSSYILTKVISYFFFYFFFGGFVALFLGSFITPLLQTTPIVSVIIVICFFMILYVINILVLFMHKKEFIITDDKVFSYKGRIFSTDIDHISRDKIVNMDYNMAKYGLIEFGKVTIETDVHQEDLELDDVDEPLRLVDELN